MNASPDAKLEVSVNGGRKAGYPLKTQGRNEAAFLELELTLQSGANEIILLTVRAASV